MILVVLNCFFYGVVRVCLFLGINGIVVVVFEDEFISVIVCVIMFFDYYK